MKSLELFRDSAPWTWAVLLGVSMCACDREKHDPPPAKPSAVPQVESQPPPAPEKPWYEGHWTGQLSSPSSDEATAGELELRLEESGRVLGQLTTPHGKSQARGQKDAERMRIRLVGPEYFGTLVCKREGDQWVGTLHASKEGTLDLDAQPPRFGRSWPVVLKKRR